MPSGEAALDAALRALRHRDLSAHDLEQRLGAFQESEREEAIETLLRTGLLDDARFAESRARTLAGRGAGDAFIRHALGVAGVAPDLVEGALETIEPEAERVRPIVERRGAGPKTARYLIAKGFSEEIVAGVVAVARGNELG